MSIQLDAQAGEDAQKQQTELLTKPCIRTPNMCEETVCTYGTSSSMSCGLRPRFARPRPRTREWIVTLHAHFIKLAKKEDYTGVDPKHNERGPRSWGPKLVTSRAGQRPLGAKELGATAGNFKGEARATGQLGAK